MKKIFTAFLIALQILSFSAHASELQLTDTQKEDLYNLGIMIGDDSGNLRLNDTVTRAEAAKMICTAGNIIISADTEDNIFNDLSKEHWAYKYIYTLKKNGIINGDNKGNFNPESNITNEEIVKMLVCLLGYGDLAEMTGGYPAGYTAAASSLGVTSGLNLKTKSPAVRNDTAIMICNALDVPIMVTSNEEHARVYTILDGQNGIPFSSIRGTRGIAPDTSLEHIDNIVRSFASQYPYKEGDTEKSFELYPDIVYTSATEKTADGTEYEFPAMYDDNMVQNLVSEIQVTPATLAVGASNYEIQYTVFKSKILVPYEALKVLDCTVSFDKDKYVAEINKNNTTLEIIPNIIGMRKNKAEGYWVPLEACARFINDTLYVPLEAVAKEFGYETALDHNTNVITLK